MAGVYIPNEDHCVNADFASAFEHIPSDEHDDGKNEVEYGDTVIYLDQQSRFGSPQKERADGRPEFDGPRKSYENLPEEYETGQLDCCDLSKSKNIKKYLPKTESEERKCHDKDDQYPEVVDVTAGQAFPEELNSSDGKLPGSISAKKNKGHLFISYCWKEKEFVAKLREGLKKEGVEVWIDVERITGSIYDAMAQAVQNAAVVLICVSKGYKQSCNCQLEAEYTFQMRKEMIPIMVEKGYRPDGWLGLLVGAKLYIDFCGEYSFQTQMNSLLRQLEIMGMLSVLKNNALDVGTQTDTDMWEDACENLSFPASSTPITSFIVTERAPSPVQKTTEVDSMIPRTASEPMKCSDYPESSRNSTTVTAEEHRTRPVKEGRKTCTADDVYKLQCAVLEKELRKNDLQIELLHFFFFFFVFIFFPIFTIICSMILITKV